MLDLFLIMNSESPRPIQYKFINPFSNVYPEYNKPLEWYECDINNIPIKCMPAKYENSTLQLVPICSHIPKIYHSAILKYKLGKSVIIQTE